ncbi:MAG: hypothetical protein QG656_1793, partial [Candidatus Hydrogenedentes bacterium]|nr:hypothetical protein [Candidatus Hydrogenedentota bacterium]
VYDPEGGPTVRIDLLTENGKVLPEENPQRSTNDVAEGWTFIQNRQLRMRPSFDADLFRRLLEVLGR